MSVCGEKGCKMNKYFFVFVIILSFGLGFWSGNYKADNYEILYSKKVNCDILLNKRTGETWFNLNGFWEKLSKDIVK